MYGHGDSYDFEAQTEASFVHCLKGFPLPSLCRGLFEHQEGRWGKGYSCVELSSAHISRNNSILLLFSILQYRSAVFPQTTSYVVLHLLCKAAGCLSRVGHKGCHAYVQALGGPTLYMYMGPAVQDTGSKYGTAGKPARSFECFHPSIWMFRPSGYGQAWFQGLVPETSVAASPLPVHKNDLWGTGAALQCLPKHRSTCKSWSNSRTKAPQIHFHDSISSCKMTPGKTASCTLKKGHEGCRCTS